MERGIEEGDKGGTRILRLEDFGIEDEFRDKGEREGSSMDEGVEVVGGFCDREGSS